MCDGSALSRMAYAALFAVIGTTFGAGDGANTFNVPDLRGRVIAGVDNMGGTAAGRLTSGGSGVNGASRGATGGGETHTLTTAQMPAHTHANTLNDPGHAHSVYDPGHAHSYSQPYRAGWEASAGGTGIAGSIQANSTGAAGTGIAIYAAGTGMSINNASQGSGGAHPNVQPTMVLNYIIKT